MKLPAGQYFGSPRSQVRFGDLIISELTYARDRKFPKHSHENAYVILVLDGTQMEDGGRCSYERGLLALHPADESHYHQIGPTGLQCLNLELGGNWLAANPEARQAISR